MLLASLLGGGVAVSAQTPTPLLPVVETAYDFYADRPYRGALPRPEVLLGYETGDSYANHAEMMQVIRTYAAASDRVRVLELGRSVERRALPLLVISSPENLRRLDAIQAANLRLADGRRPLVGADLDQAVERQPIIVWLGYNIHGDEAAGTEAALRVMYELLDGDAADVRGWLETVVVVMQPCLNPDGRERFVAWANAHGLGRPENFALEKENPWFVQGRLNHYYFDLNRDMITTSQVESRAAAAAYLAWLPQVAADHHGETKEYFFPPAALPINPNLPGPELNRWLEVFGRANAAAFDAHGWMYYVRDIFDVFYAGYWDSWPSLQGAVGMTYETSGGGKNGRRHRRDDGTIMTLRQAIAKHFTASLTTIATAAQHRRERLRDFHAHFVDAVAAGRQGAVQRVFLPPDGDPAERWRLIEALRRSGVEVQRMTAEARLRATPFAGGEASERLMPVDTFVVDLAQPHGRLARAVLEPHTVMDEAFVTRQREKLARNQDRGEHAPEDDLEFYDLTAWSLPLMFGVPAYWAGEVATLATEPLGVGPDATPAEVEVPVARSAYVLPAGTLATQRAGLHLLHQGYRVSTAARPFQVGAERFPRGSLIVRVERNPAGLHAAVQAVAAWGAKPVAVDTAFADAGITGIGSESVFALKAPKVLLAAGEPVTPTSYGALRHLWDDTFGLDYVPVAVDTLTEIDLREFNVIVLPSGNAKGYARRLGDEGQASLKAWIEAGGTLICLGGASELAVDLGEDWTSVTRVGDEESKETDDPAGETAAIDEPAPVPGAVLRAVLDEHHFLAFGHSADELPYLVSGDTFFTASTTGTNVVTYAPDNLWLAGHVWPDNTERLIAGTAAVVHEPLGAGHLILFRDEPGFRGLWRGSVRLLMNAILYAPGLGHQTGNYVK